MAEIVVIGGGIVGAAAAYRLVGRGLTVTVVDRADSGHATAAGAGIVPCAWPDPVPEGGHALDALLQRACDYYQELIPQLADDGEADTGFTTVGALLVASNGGARTPLADEYDRLVAAGKAAHLGAAEAKRLFPPLRADIEVIHVPEHARVDGRRLRDALLRGVEKRGGRLVRGEARLVSEGGRVKAVEVEGTRIHADAVIAAVGAWGDGLGLKLDVYPQRGQILHLDLPGVDTSRWPIVADDFRHQYAVPFPTNRVVAGATFEDDAGYDYRVTAVGQAKLLADALYLAPGLEAATVIETRVGFRPKSRDGLPILGAVSEVEGLYVATGLGEIGLTMGPYAGALVGDVAIGESVSVDMAPYSPARTAQLADTDATAAPV
jgi:D-amino-acid dehydrogenase